MPRSKSSSCTRLDIRNSGSFDRSQEYDFVRDRNVIFCRGCSEFSDVPFISPRIINERDIPAHLNRKCASAFEKHEFEKHIKRNAFIDDYYPKIISSSGGEDIEIGKAKGSKVSKFTLRDNQTNTGGEKFKSTQTEYNHLNEKKTKKSKHKSDQKNWNKLLTSQLELTKKFSFPPLTIKRSLSDIPQTTDLCRVNNVNTRSTLSEFAISSKTYTIYSQCSNCNQTQKDLKILPHIQNDKKYIVTMKKKLRRKLKKEMKKTLEDKVKRGKIDIKTESEQDKYDLMKISPWNFDRITNLHTRIEILEKILQNQLGMNKEKEESKLKKNDSLHLNNSDTDQEISKIRERLKLVEKKLQEDHFLSILNRAESQGLKTCSKTNDVVYGDERLHNDITKKNNCCDCSSSSFQQYLQVDRIMSYLKSDLKCANSCMPRGNSTTPKNYESKLEVKSDFVTKCRHLGGKCSKMFNFKRKECNRYDIKVSNDEKEIIQDLDALSKRSASYTIKQLKWHKENYGDGNALAYTSRPKQKNPFKIPSPPLTQRKKERKKSRVSKKLCKKSSMVNILCLPQNGEKDRGDALTKKWHEGDADFKNEGENKFLDICRKELNHSTSNHFKTKKKISNRVIKGFSVRNSLNEEMYLEVGAQTSLMKGLNNLNEEGKKNYGHNKKHETQMMHYSNSHFWSNCQQISSESFQSSCQNEVNKTECSVEETNENQSGKESVTPSPLKILKQGGKIKIPVLFEELCPPEKKNHNVSNISMKFVMVKEDRKPQGNPLKKLIRKLSRTKPMSHTEKYIFGVTKCRCSNKAANGIIN